MEPGGVMDVDKLVRTVMQSSAPWPGSWPGIAIASAMRRSGGLSSGSRAPDGDDVLGDWSDQKF